MVANALVLLGSSAHLRMSSASKLLCRVCLSKTAFQFLPARLPFIVCLSTSAFQFLPARLPFIVCLSSSALQPVPARVPFNLCPSHFTTGECSSSSSASLASKPVNWNMQAQRITLQITQTHTLTSQDTNPVPHPIQPPHQPPTPPPVSSQHQISQMILLISPHHRLIPTIQRMSQQWPVMCPLSSGLLQLT